MKQSKEIQGFYGYLEPIPATIFIHNGWYCVEGSVNVSKTHEEIDDGCHIEFLEDCDTFTWNEPIETLDQLIEAVEF